MLPTGTITFLFTDIENSVEHWERESEQMRAALAHHDAILRQAVETHGGQVYKVVGDACQAAFAHPAEALAAAVAAQRALAAQAWPTSSPLRVRMGLHAGPAEVHGNDYAASHTLNRVARIISAGHGGQILLSAAVADLVRGSLPAQAALRDLGQHRLKGLTQPEHLYQVVTANLPAEFPPPKSLDAVPSNLPASLMPLLGRERETTALRQLLARPDGRLVTITGPGGVGKTSLSLQVAQALRDAFTGGVFFISLAPLNDSTLVWPTVARTLGLAESPNRLILDSLKEFLRDKRTLLLFDNFEQITSAAPLLTELLSACIELRMLVTSREALRLRGEREFPLSPLELSSSAPVTDRASVEKLLQFPSIALFVQRAQAHLPDFNLTADNAAAVAEICARLDGLPLALELAAARIKLLPPQAMLTRLQKSSLGLLTSGARDLPARQQTLRGAIQWSYDLLGADEQRTFRWLSVFVTGGTLEAAASVSGEQSSVIVLDHVDSLIHKSLIQQIEIDGEPRLSMLDTIREFGLECLARAQELEAARSAHAAYCLSLAEEAEPHLTGADQKKWLQRLDREQDNLRAALRWGIENHEAGFVLRLTGVLWRFWHSRGQWSEGRRWLEEALSMNALGAGDQAFQAKALHGAGTLARFQGDMARALRLGEQSVASYRTLGDKEGLLSALMQLGRTLSYQVDGGPLETLLIEAAALAEELPDSPVKAQAYNEMVMLNFLGRSPADAARYLAESERINRALNNPAGLAYTVLLQGMVATFAGDFARASACYDEAGRLAVEAGDRRIGARVPLNLAILDWLRGDYVSARRDWDDYLQMGQSLGDFMLPIALEGLAATLQRQGLSPWAARVFGMADAWMQKGQITNAEFKVEAHLGLSKIRAEVRVRLGEEAYAKEWAEGRKLTLDALLAIPHPPRPGSAGRVQAGSASLPNESLTERELEVLRLLAQDLSNPQIAERLVVSRRTVEAHLRTIYEKLGVKSRDAAIRVATGQGLLGNRQAD